MSRTVVIGSGIIGLLCAYQLHRRGEEVVLVDRAEPGLGCSSGNAGWIVPALSGPVPAPGLTRTSLKWMLRRDSPLYISPRSLPALAPWLWSFWRHCNERDYSRGLEATARLAEPTMGLFDDLRGEGLEFEMHCSGLLFVSRDTADLEHINEDLDRLAGHGVQPAEILTADQVRLLEPGLTDAVAGGVLAPDQRHLRPESLVDSLVRYLEDAGVTSRAGVEMIGADIDQKTSTIRSIRTSDGPISGDTFVVAAGAWSGIIARSLGSRLPVQAGTGYSATVSSAELNLRHPLYLVDTRVACSPFNDSVRLAGTMELSGIRRTHGMRRAMAMIAAAARYFPSWRVPEDIVPWAGMRPMTPDGLPVIGRLPETRNGYVATGHAMLGMTLAPVTALAVTDLITLGATEHPIDAFSPARFS